MNPDWFGYSAALLIAAMSIPQFLRIIRDRSAEGVSLGTWLLFGLSATSWLAYGISTSAVAVIVGNALFMATVLPVIVILLIRQRGWPTIGAAAATVSAAAAGVLVLTLLPERVPGWLGVAVGIATTVPQLVTSRANRRLGRPSEVSVLAYALLICGQVLWFTYGVTRGDLPIIVVNTIAIGINVCVVITELSRERAQTN